MNKQPIEKRDFHPEGRLWVHSIFYTIQGEGPFAGTPAVFVRLQGCNLQCPGCDTIYTTPKGERRTILQSVQRTPEDIVGRIRAAYTDIAVPRTRILVVITGGEPFRQNLIPLFARLEKEPNWFVQIETNGTLSPFMGANLSVARFYNTRIDERRGRYIVCSPKAPKCDPMFDAVACCFKYVLDHRSVDPADGLPLHVLGNSAPKRVYRQRMPIRPIYLQPMDHSMEYPEDHEDGARNSILLLKENANSLEAVKRSCLRHGYILQLQVHKMINVE